MRLAELFPSFRSVAVRPLLLVFGLSLLAGASFAQTNSLAGRLPANAWLVLHWNGTSSLHIAQSSNSVLRLWRDPSFAAARAGLIDRISQGAKQKNPKSNSLTQEQTDEILSLLENQFVFGFINHAGNAPGSTAKSVSSFLIYDATGKQSLIDKFNAERVKNSGSPFERTPLPIGSFTGYKVVSGKDTSYEVQAGSYFLRTDTLATMEELLPRITAVRPPSQSFEEAATVPSACRTTQQGYLLDFLALPGKLNFSAMPPDPNFNFAAFAKTTHLDQVQAVCGSVAFEAQATRVRGVVLGDTSQGSILNIIGNDRGTFATLVLASAASSYQCSILDFVSLYKTLLAGFSAALPPDKAGFAAGLDSLASTLWGMPPAEALGLFTGEFAKIDVNTAADPTRSIYALTIQRPEKLLALLQHIIPGATAAQKQDGDTTYVTLTFPQNPRASQNPPSEPSSFFFAVTPAMLVASKEQTLVHNAVARLHAPANSAQSDTLSNDPGFKTARVAVPAKLVNLSYADLAHYNFASIIATIEKGFNQQAEASARRAGKPAPPPIKLLPGFDPAVISKYLHSSIGGAWKDSTGIYFDAFIQ